MATIAYDFDVGQTVWYLDNTTGVHEAVVQTVSIVIAISGSTTSYSIAFTTLTNGTLITTEDTLYPDVDSALAVYRVNLLA